MKTFKLIIFLAGQSINCINFAISGQVRSAFFQTFLAGSLLCVSIFPLYPLISNADVLLSMESRSPDELPFRVFAPSPTQHRIFFLYVFLDNPGTNEIGRVEWQLRAPEIFETRGCLRHEPYFSSDQSDPAKIIDDLFYGYFIDTASEQLDFTNNVRAVIGNWGPKQKKGVVAVYGFGIRTDTPLIKGNYTFEINNTRIYSTTGLLIPSLGNPMTIKVIDDYAILYKTNIVILDMVYDYNSNLIPQISVTAFPEMLRLEASKDLINWIPLMTNNVLINFDLFAPFDYYDNDATNYSIRFYRTKYGR